MDEQQKKALTEIASSYNEDLQLEKLYRDNMIRNLVACIIWISITIGEVWLPEVFNFPRWIVTGYGTGLIALCVLSFWTIRARYKQKVKAILYARQACLQIRDNFA